MFSPLLTLPGAAATLYVRWLYSKLDLEEADEIFAYMQFGARTMQKHVRLNHVDARIRLHTADEGMTARPDCESMAFVPHHLQSITVSFLGHCLIHQVESGK